LDSVVRLFLSIIKSIKAGDSFLLGGFGIQSICPTLGASSFFWILVSDLIWMALSISRAEAVRSTLNSFGFRFELLGFRILDPVSLLRACRYGIWQDDWFGCEVDGAFGEVSWIARV